MRRLTRHAALSVLTAAALGFGAARAGAQTPSGAASAPEPMRGAPGDTVRVIVNHVRPDKRDQFEHFVHDVLYPAMRQEAPTNQTSALQMRRARLLRPTAPSADSTLPYVFIVDPVVTSAGYSFPRLLTSVFGQAKGNEYWQLFRETLARPQETYLVVNERW